MNNKLACLILSKSRPLLFDATIRSTLQNFPHVDKFFFLLVDNKDIALYDDWLLNEYKSSIPTEIIKEKHIRPDLIITLNNIIKQGFAHTLFLTDDTFFFRKFPYPKEMIFHAFDNPQVLTVGLRMGENTVVQNPYNPSEKLHVPTNWYSDFAVWDWTKESHDKNTGYPISMDGHIYRTQDMLDMTESIQFKNLREWEGNLVGNLWANKGKFPRFTGDMMGCFKESTTVNIPISMVQYPFQANVSPYGVSTEQMLDLWKQGKRIDLEKMFKNVVVNGSHILTPLAYKD